MRCGWRTLSNPSAICGGRRRPPNPHLLPIPAAPRPHPWSPYHCVSSPSRRSWTGKNAPSHRGGKPLTGQAADNKYRIKILISKSRFSTTMACLMSRNLQATVRILGQHVFYFLYFSCFYSSCIRIQIHGLAPFVFTFLLFPSSNR